jgi:hypothetical protein
MKYLLNTEKYSHVWITSNNLKIFHFVYASIGIIQYGAIDRTNKITRSLSANQNNNTHIKQQVVTEGHSLSSPRLLEVTYGRQCDT